MFWGCFAGNEKGPCLSWEKQDWGSITSETYCERILPLIDGMIYMRPWLLMMQDNAPSHSAKDTTNEFRQRHTTPI